MMRLIMRKTALLALKPWISLNSRVNSAEYLPARTARFEMLLTKSGNFFGKKTAKFPRLFAPFVSHFTKSTQIW